MRHPSDFVLRSIFLACAFVFISVVGAPAAYFLAGFVVGNAIRIV